MTAPTSTVETGGPAADGRWATRLLNGVWLLTSALTVLVMGPATAISPPASRGYLLYHQTGLCIPNTPRVSVAAGDDPLARPPETHHFRPRVTKDAVLPMSSGPRVEAGPDPAASGG
jgi:hypothetical protein